MSVRTSQETHYINGIEANQLMLFAETVAVYCEIHTENKYTVWAECTVYTGKADDTCSNL
jgi:hypothetical protein